MYELMTPVNTKAMIPLVFSRGWFNKRINNHELLCLQVCR
uniref:Uncharacterized protein n=1 Tax=Salmonella enterica subsp. salamae TaxID=59202 RepID=I3W439_SALER|nr:hypothetical protein [Salmonella enterica subsp. salamae]